jgi:hypothetical protein
LERNFVGHIRSECKPGLLKDHSQEVRSYGLADDDPNLASSELATVTAKKITWATAGRATDPGRYMFRFGWLTITANDLAIWRAYPNAAFTLIRTLTSPRRKPTRRLLERNFVWAHSI